MVLNDLYDLNMCEGSLELYNEHLSSSGCTNQLCAAAMKDTVKCIYKLLAEIRSTRHIAILSIAETYVLKKALQYKKVTLHQARKRVLQTGFYASQINDVERLIEKINDMEQLLYYNRTHHPDKVEELKSIFQVFTLETHITPSLAF